VKTVSFANARYIGDAINAVSIFNDKMVDELVVLDIDAPRCGTAPRMELIRELATECFMPLGYGGGISTVAQAERIFSSGIEKVIFNTTFLEAPDVVRETARMFGRQGVVVGIDYRRSRSGACETYVKAGSKPTGLDPIAHARKAEETGAGELILQSIDRDGRYEGYDLELIRSVSDAVDIPVVALGGARDVNDLAAAVHQGGAAAAAAGSMFVFFGRLKAVLINTPDEPERLAAFVKTGQGAGCGANVQ
jgi:cyclase